MSRLRALVLLGWSLIRVLLAPVFGLRRGLADFRRSYAADRLPAVRPDERRAFPELGRCIACGLCDAGEGARIAQAKGAYGGVMNLMLASSRSMPDYDAAARSFAFIGDDRLAELERRCPARVPMREVAAFVRAKASEMDETPVDRAAVEA